MRIVLDDHELQTTGPAGQTVQELLAEACPPAAGPDARMVVALKCDGQPVGGNNLQSMLTRPASQFATIEIQTLKAREQVAATLSQAIEVIRHSREIRDAAADCLDQGRHEDAMRELRKLLEVFRQVQQTTALSCQILGIDPAGIGGRSAASPPNGVDFNTVLECIRECLAELKTAMESQDFVLVSDLLRYQFEEPSTGWLQILDHLHQSAAAPA